MLLLAQTVGCASFRKDPLSLHVIDARQMSLRGLDAIHRQRFDEAESWFAEACATNPADERAHCEYAELLWRRGMEDHAILHLEQAVNLSGGDPKLRVRLGELYLARGDASSAWTQAQQAVRTHRHLACAWALQGDIHRAEGRWQDAVAAYHRSLSYESHCPHVQLALAEIYRRQNRPRRALSTLEALADHYPPEETPPEVLVAQGLALKALRRYDDAIERFSRAIERTPPDAELFFQLAEAYHLSGDATSARLAVSAALADQPQHLASRELQVRLDQQQPMTASATRF